MNAPRVFEDAGRIFRADTCEPLKAAIARQEVGFHGWARRNYPGVQLTGRILEGICSIGVWDARNNQEWGLGEHCNEGLEITYLSRGALDFTAEDRHHRLVDGQITVTRPWQVHEVGSPLIGPSRLAWIIIDVNIRRPNQEWRWPEWVLLTANERQRISRLIQNTDQTVWSGALLSSPFEELIQVVQTGDPVRVETESKLILNTILLRLLRTLDLGDDYSIPSRDGARQTVRIFLSRLRDHLGYEWTLNEMAEQCGVSRSGFIEHCRSILNDTPHAFLSALRLERARLLLQTRSDLNLTDIAFECGFGSSAYFSATFRRSTGQSPSQFRRGNRSARPVAVENPVR